MPKLLAAVAMILFAMIGVIAFFKKPAPSVKAPQAQVPIEIVLDQDTVSLPPPVVPQKSPETPAELPEADRIEEFFNKEGPKLPLSKRLLIRAMCPGKRGGPLGYPIMPAITKPRVILLPAASMASPIISNKS